MWLQSMNYTLHDWREGDFPQISKYAGLTMCQVRKNINPLIICKGFGMFLF